MTPGAWINTEATHARKVVHLTPHMSITIVLIFSAAAAAVVAVFIKGLAIPRTRVHTSVQAIRALLSPPDLPISALLRARATPNKRLVKALGITSTFVSEDP